MGSEWMGGVVLGRMEANDMGGMHALRSNNLIAVSLSHHYHPHHFAPTPMQSLGGMSLQSLHSIVVWMVMG